MNKLVFITGGVRSGKSAFAEKLAIEKFYNNQKNIFYLATGVAFDEEMKKRISHHKKGRLQSGVSWKTIEFEGSIPTFPVTNGDVILWDCITTWINNILYITEKEENRFKEIQHYLDNFKMTLLNWQKQGAHTILVSNEVLDENKSTYEEVNLYRKILGNLHQWIVEMCDEAYEMDYGLILRKK